MKVVLACLVFLTLADSTGITSYQDCNAGCTSEKNTCVDVAKNDTSANEICADKHLQCSTKCDIPGFPEAAYDCVNQCKVQLSACANTSTSDRECKNQEMKCSSKCLDPYIPDCLQADYTRIFKCTNSTTQYPKDCAGLNTVITCLKTECNGTPTIFATAYRLDDKIKHFCPTLSPTVVGGTLSPTVSDYVGVVPSAGHVGVVPTPEPSAGSTVSCVLQLVSVLIVCLML